jgi:hypothetical protein
MASALLFGSPSESAISVSDTDRTRVLTHPRI